jgi:integrase
MASIKATAAGWRAQVYVHGVRDSASFRTRREAAAWAAVRESELRAEGARSPAERHTLAQALERYRAEVSPTKRGQRWEDVRIASLLRSALPVARPIGQVTPGDLAIWRDERMREVSAGTVLRDLSLLSAIFEHARREWRWIASNPVADVRKPRAPDHRSVVLTRAQIKAMLRALGYVPTAPVRSVNQSVAVALLLALRSGMRAGELCGLEWSRVHDGWCRLPTTKTTPRDVPLTPKAMRLVGKMRGFDRVRVFGLKVQSLDTLFRRARDQSGLSGFVFHDSRHTAATWLAQRLHVLDLCKMFGWANPKQAMAYYNPSAAEIARRIGQTTHPPK